MVQALTTGATPTVLLRNAADARYVPTGHLAYLRQEHFSWSRSTPPHSNCGGDEVAVLNEVAQAVAAWAGPDLTLAGQLAISPRARSRTWLARRPQFPSLT